MDLGFKTMSIYWRFRKLVDFFRYDLWLGIKNLYVWFPIIWNDFDWDWSQLAKIMEFKMRRMAPVMQSFVGSEEVEKELYYLADLLKELREDDPLGWDHAVGDEERHDIMSEHLKRMDYIQKKIGKVIGKNMRTWWD